MNLKKALGKNIKKYRQTNNLTIKNLSSILNISYSYLKNIEEGKCNLSIKLINEIANALNIDIKDLFK